MLDILLDDVGMRCMWCDAVQGNACLIQPLFLHSLMGNAGGGAGAATASGGGRAACRLRIHMHSVFFSIQFDLLKLANICCSTRLAHDRHKPSRQWRQGWVCERVQKLRSDICAATAGAREARRHLLDAGAVAEREAVRAAGAGARRRVARPAVRRALRAQHRLPPLRHG